MSRVNINLSMAKIQKIVDTSRELDQMVRDKAEDIIEAAKQVFEMKEIHTNEDRLSSTTPPKWMSSFKLRRIRRIAGPAWQAVNTDPGAIWVEFGANAGGKVQILRYRPLGTALDMVGDSGA